MADNSNENAGNSTGNKRGFKKFLKSLSPARWAHGGAPFRRKKTSGESDQTRAFSLDLPPTNTGKPAAHPGHGEQAGMTETEMANMERRRRRMSSQAQLGGLSPNTALTSHTTSTTERTEARDFEEQIRKKQKKAETIRTTRMAYRASRDIECVMLTLMLENVLSHASPTSDPAKMTSRGRIEKY